MSTINRHCYTGVRHTFINISFTLMHTTYLIVGKPFANLEYYEKGDEGGMTEGRK